MELQVGDNKLGSIRSVNGIGQVSRQDESARVADIIIVVADDLDLAAVNVADGLVRERVTKDDSRADLAHIIAQLIGGVVNRETTLGVTAHDNLGIRALGQSIANHTGPIKLLDRQEKKLDKERRLTWCVQQHGQRRGIPGQTQGIRHLVW